MTITGRQDVTSAEAKAIHKAAQDAAENGTGPRHDEVPCWCCCFECDFAHWAVIANDKTLGVPSEY